MREALLLAAGRLVCTAPWFIVCCVPFYPERRVSRRVMVTVITGGSLLFFLCNFILQLYFESYLTYTSLVFLVMYLVMGGFFIWGFRTSAVKLLYVFLLAQAVSTDLNYTAAIFLRPFYPEERITLQSTPAYTVMIFVMTLFLAPAIWYFFSHQLREAMKELRNRDFRLLCIPPVLFFIVTLVFYDIGANPAIPQEQAISLFLLISAIGLATYFLNVRLALDTAHRARLETNITAMERQLAVQAQSYATLAKNIEAARVARHDLRHHLAAMTYFVEQNDMNGLADYLAKYQQSIPDENTLSVCDNDAVDMVVRHYLQQAKNAGAELDIKLNLPAKIPIVDTDLTILFGNLFENAAQGVAQQKEGKRFIHAHCGIERGKLILTVDNSTDPKQLSETNPRLGIGQTSVMAVTEKYHGTARFEQGYDSYQVSILLILPSQE